MASGRKPPGTPFEDWVERQVREAQERGDFDHLPGAGAPLPGLDREFSAEQWAADKARREGYDVTAMLPPALALRREREVLLRDVAQLGREPAVREVVADFNDRVRELYRRPADGPLVVVALLDEEAVLEAWRAARPAPAAPAAVEPPARRRRWFRRRTR
ncbi:hypothetical protein FHR75_001146 [Kineococcus radiotolerans]|uniref:DnaJ homologue subfamily C member 28 conserved domain-containing protein n=2 Tax=Kineococcus radiotolerans TaxID=131568 RepID=A6W6K9_KINRD|nr:DUF1992 domain-containing protein [Kineococcus radiotolerans]ABS02448.1 conserved hypothetical protein [Kineococcus radiotolerans SRS30216 = ATCC BAA-149]MBB2900358.1 hypothetical protein [Kineococcus radiotolerans]